MFHSRWNPGNLFEAKAVDRPEFDSTKICERPRTLAESRTIDVASSPGGKSTHVGENSHVSIPQLLTHVVEE